MNGSINPKQLVGAFSRFLHRFHVLIFTLIVLGSLAYATFTLNATISQPPVELPDTTSATFDNETIEKVKSLRKTTESSQKLELPNGRIDPFN